MTGDVVNTFFKFLKVFSAFGGSLPFFYCESFRVKVIKWALAFEKFGINSLKKLAIPMNLLTSLTFFSSGKFLITLVLSEPGLMSSAQILNPKYSVSVSPKS